MSAQNSTSNDHLNSALSKLTSLVDNNFECSICLDTFSDPHLIPECLHRFCGACVKESIRKCGAECPKCRARITTKRGLRKDNDFEEMMNKVNSAIKSLECAATISQVNVKEDIEVAHFGHGHVKTEEIEETDASKNADEPIQYANEGVMPRRSKRLDRSMPRQAMTSQENSVAARSKERDSGTTEGGARKRKSENASVLQSNKKCTRSRRNPIHVSRNNTSVTINRKALVFEERCVQLLAFEDEFGHCNVPRGYADNPSLGSWCNNMRNAYTKIQKGMKTKLNLSQDRIERLEEIGFQWQGVDYDEAFEERCRELMAFKDEFGHCNVPQRCVNNPSLGSWCNNMRAAHTKIQKGMKTKLNLSQDRIERLEEIGFQWQGVDYDEAFEKRCHELMAFKDEFGHCNVPKRCANNPSLGRWCGNMRAAHTKIQKGMKADYNLSQDRIERLEEIGFKWQVLTV